jgi:RimJ/RimL family protein N-acetyltransferase
VAPDAVATRFPERVTLRDGSEVVVRPIEPGDKEKLVEGFERLSPESRYRRFLTPMNRLTPRMLRYPTEVDHHDHEALVAESADGAEPVGVARFIRIADEPEAAEVAVAVVNHWQGRGAARALMRRLAARAVEEGVERFTATCLAENTDVLELLGDLAPARVTESADGLVEVEIALPTGEEKSLLAALRRAAAGALAFRHPLERR